ncbi:unnamed protein product [Victoria cruziana]
MFRPCLSGDTISAGQSVAGKQTITSEGGMFESGYFSLGTPPRYYIGIWYKAVTIDNVVWVANRDMPLPDDAAELKISEDGSNLVIETKSGFFVWSTNLTRTPSSHAVARVAVLENNGNLVLRDANSSRAVWESFDHPTDTFLSEGRLGVNRVTGQYIAITSWKSRDDPSSGLFSQKINPNGDLELLLYWNNSRAYWTTGVWNGQIFSGVPEMRSASFYNYSFIVNDNMSYYTYLLHDSRMLMRTKIDIDGQIEQATWNRAAESWGVFWSQPKDQCDVYALCGAFGVCNSQNTQNICRCLDGFEPVSAQEWESNSWSGGCKTTRKNTLGCDGDQFTKVSIRSSPDHSNVNTTNTTAESCASACSRDCSCTAHSYQDGTCFIWKGDVLNLVQGANGGSIFVRVAIGAGKSGGGKKQYSRSVIVTVSVTVPLMLVAAAGACYFCKHKEKKSGKDAEEQGDVPTGILLGEAMNESGGPDLPFYRLRDIMAATEDFSERNKLGRGGFGPVYRGKLREGQEVAIKRLSRGSKQGIEEFMNELNLIAKLQHTNLVQILGCCAEGEERILIYEYMPNKSLDHFLFDPILRRQLDWQKRFEIVMGIGRGLQYLHQDSRLKIIHRDLKSSNILLDAAMNPRISDFGLARIFCDEQSHVSTVKVAGTCGYMPPEYAMEGRYSTKSDVFSFGVIVLEIVSGLRMTSFRNEEYSLNLLGHAWKLWNEDKVAELLDHSLGTPHELEQVLRCVNVGLLCVQEDAMERPTMSSAVTMLSSNSANLFPPKQPAYSRKARSPDEGSTKFELGNSSTNNLTLSVLQPR